MPVRITFRGFREFRKAAAWGPKHRMDIVSIGIVGSGVVAQIADTSEARLTQARKQYPDVEVTKDADGRRDS